MIIGEEILWRKRSIEEITAVGARVNKKYYNKFSFSLIFFSAIIIVCKLLQCSFQPSIFEDFFCVFLQLRHVL